MRILYEKFRRSPVVGRLHALILAALVLTMTVAQPSDGAMRSQIARGHLAALAAKTPQRTRRGRPRKFAKPSRAVTLTLPEDVIAQLRAVDADLSRAVVRLAESAPPTEQRRPAELTVFGDRAVIVVSPTPALTARTDAEFVPLADGRALIAFDDSLSVSQFELQIRDALGDPQLAGADRALFVALASILQNTRRGTDMTLQHRSIVVLQREERGKIRRSN